MATKKKTASADEAGTDVTSEQLETSGDQSSDSTGTSQVLGSPDGGTQDAGSNEQTGDAEEQAARLAADAAEAQKKADEQAASELAARLAAEEHAAAENLAAQRLAEDDAYVKAAERQAEEIAAAARATVFPGEFKLTNHTPSARVIGGVYVVGSAEEIITVKDADELTRLQADVGQLVELLDDFQKPDGQPMPIRIERL